MATGSDIIYEHACSPCEADGLNNEATAYCRQCETPLCDPCVKQHNRFLKDHIVLDRGEVDRWIPAIYDFPKDHVFSVKSERKVNVRVNTDKEICQVNDICFMHNGRIMLVDATNASLKVLNKENTKVDEYPFPKPYLPNGVSHATNRKYMACVRDGEKRRVVQFQLGIHNKIEILDTFLIDHKAFTIGICKNRLYVTSETGLFVYSMSGTLQNVLFRDISSTGCDSLAFSDSGKEIHVTHRTAPSMTTIGEDGKQFSSLTDCDLESTPGVLVLPNNTIVICGFNVGRRRIKISQIRNSRKGATTALIDRPYTDGMWPFRMGYSPHTGELIVGGTGDTILILSLQ